MDNIVYTYNNRTVNGYSVKDFSSIYFGDLYLELTKHPEYFEFIDISPDEKIENLSWQLYGSENYADVILACNKENFLWCVPFNQDIVLEQGDLIFEKFIAELNLSESNIRDLSDSLEFNKRLKDNLDDINSSKKRFRIPKPEFLTDVLAVINNYKKDHNDTKWRLNQYAD